MVEMHVYQLARNSSPAARLLAAVFIRKYESQCEVAAMRIWAMAVSCVVRGRGDLGSDSRRSSAKVLGAPAQRLFPEDNGDV
jgi:hypothetical protein